MNSVYKLTSPRNENVFIHLVKGHFVSANNHINYYIGTSDVKHNHDVSVDTAMLLSEYYNSNEIQADTVLCLYETQALGAYLAHELSRPNMYRYDSKREIYVVGSEYDSSGNIIFRDNLVRMIKDKNVIVLISAITSGKTVERAMESVQYYGGNVIGISGTNLTDIDPGETESFEVSGQFFKDATYSDIAQYKVIPRAWYMQF